MTSSIIIALGVLLALVLPLWIYPWLSRLGVVDLPNARSSHEVPTVRGMGVALAIAACLTTASLAVVEEEGPGHLVGLTLLGAAAASLGFLEDLRGIPVAKRAGLQILIGAIFGVVVVWLSGGDDWFWVPISAIAVAAYINVANFMDGINGISGLHGGIAGISYAVLGAVSDRLWMTQLALVATGVFLAFLPWNLSRRRVFLGDVGSYLLGAWIVGIAILAVASGISPILAAGPMVIYAADTGFTLAVRVRRGERWFEAHRSHVYQLLAAQNGQHASIALLVAGFSALTAAASFVSLHPSWIASAGSMGLMLLIAIAYLCLPKILSKRTRQSMKGAK
ncbi:MraY family glycosyltransferase [[Micrococcus luteus] ATCC 49442]|uniref:MraY family glycosyltransferase n=1 Tax=[Micrococcus luteus] ATCC 49442 TaxID=2698727 RepID=UPI0013D92E88|nr:glycosyltransferase family 4 protein [[Micrococcus luteus] ATCC 49442]